MTALPDGNYGPSFLRVLPREGGVREKASMSFALRVGTVITKYKPDDDKNLTRSTWEYDVECVTTDGMGQATLETYPHCIMASMFGSVADYLMWAPRISEKQRTSDDKPDFEGILQGSLVLLLTPNGNSSQPSLIVGAAQHPEAPKADDAFGEGQLLRFEYNGLFAEINKDGELTLTRKGPTKIDGEPETDNDTKANAELKLDKDGQVVIKTGDGKQVITMNLNDGKIVIEADQGVDIKVANGKLKTECAQGVELGGSAEKLIKGTTYQSAEKTFLTSLGQGVTTMLAAAASLSAASIEPAAAAAAPQFTAAAMQMKVAIETFKTQLENVLSQKNTTE